MLSRLAVTYMSCVLWLWAGCYSPTPPAGAPCAANDTCPRGLVCTAGFCQLTDGQVPPDAPDMMPTVDDMDGDGVLDAVDNCPGVKNADQADEDGDKIGDACDGCPQIAETAPVDADGDLIGDACDPNMASPDTLWLFEGFHGVIPAWFKSSGWAVASDALQVTAGGNRADMGEFMALPVKTGRTLDKFAISIVTSISATMGSDGEHVMGTSMYDDKLMNTVYCELQLQGNNPRVVAYEEWNDNGADPISRKTASYAWKNGSTYQLTFVRQAKNYTCTVTGPEGTVSVGDASNVAPNVDPGVEAFGVTALVSSVFVVGP